MKEIVGWRRKDPNKKDHISMFAPAGQIIDIEYECGSVSPWLIYGH